MTSDQELFMEYQNLLRKQLELREDFLEISINYKLCQCPKCLHSFITCSLKLVAINQQISSIEDELPPQLITILVLLNIPHSISDDGTVTLLDK